MYSGRLLIRTEKLALKLGSSKQGNAIRALVGSKWVEAKVLRIDIIRFFSKDTCRYVACSPCCGIVHLVSPGLSCTGSVGALIEAIETFCKFCSKLNIQEILLPTAEHSGRKNAYLLMGRVMKNWEDLEQKEIDGSDVGHNDKRADVHSQLPVLIDERGSGLIWWLWRSEDPCCVIRPSLYCSAHQSESALSQWNLDLWGWGTGGGDSEEEWCTWDKLRHWQISISFLVIDWFILIQYLKASAELTLVGEGDSRGRTGYRYSEMVPLQDEQEGLKPVVNSRWAETQPETR